MTAENLQQDHSKAREFLNDAMTFHASGDLDRAEQYYVEVLNHGYRIADILPLLAGVVGAKGKYEAAIAYWNDLLQIRPDHPVALLEKGALHLKVGDAEKAVNCFEAATLGSPDNMLALNNLAVALTQANRQHDALEKFRILVRHQPTNVLARHQVRRLTSRIVPFWHIPMLNDTRRNDAFEAAIVKAIAERGPDARVLDIGTGSGLLSLMAARAGAKQVVTCEVVPVIAATAKEIVEQNGFSDRIVVLNKSSSELVVGQDINRRADILVSEILSSDLLAEDVLTTFEDARKRLINEDALVIPRRATAVGCLVQSEILTKYAFVDQVSGFDVSGFASLAPNKLPVHGTMTEWKRLSHDVDLQVIDLTGTIHSEEYRVIDIPVVSDGMAAGMVQWLKIDLAEGIEFENHPDDYSDGGWLQILHPFLAPVPVQEGSTFRVIVGHDRSSLIVMAAPITD
ncbi:50S ribosomal protein L11 methyltransferase [Rhizobium calliandrae]|uniref:50S ribosomal protein L11 methyltransferase n=1 Tax=Rhizobium calliandrae TaxID=1312182 RepID=A0ABT7KPA8_9HYPH|nr:tetratricopeptide repeat protein [Rhizobium calliandrae]MDL2409099.1 50S ribosomal protein L11 methyltransferase [Rhizobium calliandrae]